MSTPTPPATSDAPLDNFSHCHDGILVELNAMSALPELARAAQQARRQADAVLQFYRKVVKNHHDEEERVLFEAVLRSAGAGEEHARVKAITERLTRVIPVDNILFASEMIGAVKGIDPETGFNFDDTKRYIEATLNLSAEDRYKVYEGNARRVYPRLDAALKAKGK